MGLRIGIDVGGTFTHGVVLQPPGAVIATARTPTTHTDPRGVAAGVEEVLRLLLAELEALGRDKAEVELVAHSTTQATNALLEGDLSGVELLAIVPPGERALVSRALRQKSLDIGGGHSIRLNTRLQDWADLNGATASATDLISTTQHAQPVAIVQPLAGRHENREPLLAERYRATGVATVSASSITQVLGLQARARTAVVNAAMLPTMLATADYTEAAVARLLPGVPLQVVRSDGGAMTIAEMRRQPILSLLSGPAAGASAALHRSGLSDAVFIEVGGTSTDITLIKDGRVRHRYATVGGQRLLVPALDLRTVAVGGGSMLLAGDLTSSAQGGHVLRQRHSVFGPRSAHIAGLPYLFQTVDSDAWHPERILPWKEIEGLSQAYCSTVVDEEVAAITLTDYWLYKQLKSGETSYLIELGITWTPTQVANYIAFFETPEIGFGHVDPLSGECKRALNTTLSKITTAIDLLLADHRGGKQSLKLIGGGGGGPILLQDVARELELEGHLIGDHSVISAIGAALAVTCVSLSRNVAQPSGGDIAELISEVEGRLAAQGAERVQTDYEFDPRRQVLTVTGRGSRPYEQDTEVRSVEQLRDIVKSVLKAGPALKWHDEGTWLWTTNVPSSHTRPSASLACSTDRFGRVLWLGNMATFEAAAPGRVTEALEAVVARHTQHTDGGAVLPQLGLLTGGRYIPLDQLGSAELITEVLRWEKLPAEAQGCFVVGKP
jgi:N-methylhydantoinase A/oxoprolinase/acetone carboxylase beta subunit